jgi:type IV/VI secretion system ImpK/VasF family protein
VVRTVRPFLLGVMRVQRLGDARGVDASAADRQLRALLGRTVDGLARFDLTQQDVEDIKFALVVFTDEKLQDNAGNIEAYWTKRPWAREQFGHARGGELFYTKLAEVRGGFGRLPVLAVYHVCLRLGFFGAYRGPEEHKREELVEDIEKHLSADLAVREAPLSPRAARPYEEEFDKKRNTWLAALVVAAAVVSGLVMLGLWAVVDMQAHDLVKYRILREVGEQ